jgi:hypothetical protein
MQIARCYTGSVGRYATDGDIRRGLLNNYHWMSIESIVFITPTMATPKDKEILKGFDKKHIKFPLSMMKPRTRHQRD